MTRQIAAASLAVLLAACGGASPQAAGPTRSSALVSDGGFDAAARLTVSAAAPAQVNTRAPITYSYAVHNGGVSALTNVTVTQPILAGTSFIAVSAPVWATCIAPTAGATSGSVSCNLGTLSAAASAAVAVTLEAPAGTGAVTNDSYTVASDGGAPMTGLEVATSVVPQALFADLQLTIDDGVAALPWGGATSFEVTIFNAGPSMAHAVSANLPAPEHAASASWVCTPLFGDPAFLSAARGSGPLAATIALPANSAVRCDYLAELAAGSGTSQITLQGFISDPGTLDPTPADASASDTDEIGALVQLAAAADTAGNGAGRIVSSPAVIDCGPACGGAFAAGVPVTLTAVATRGSQFTRWAGPYCRGSSNPICTFTPAADATVTARFDQLEFPIAVTVIGSGEVSCPAAAVVGSSTSCSVSASGGFRLARLTDNGPDVTGRISAGAYALVNVQRAHSLSAFFVKADGLGCASNSECGSGVCADGICCNTACDGQCQACDVPGSVGTCTTVAGQPHGGRAACAGGGTACGGTCDGSNATSCAYPGAGTSCRAGSCSQGTAVMAASCDGAGACPAEQVVSCGAYACGLSACNGNCVSDGDCASGDACAAGVCQPETTQHLVTAAAGGCSSGGGAAPILGMVMLFLFGVRRRRPVVSARVFAAGSRRSIRVLRFG